MAENAPPPPNSGRSNLAKAGGGGGGGADKSSHRIKTNNENPRSGRTNHRRGKKGSNPQPDGNNNSNNNNNTNNSNETKATNNSKKQGGKKGKQKQRSNDPTNPDKTGPNSNNNNSNNNSNNNNNRNNRHKHKKTGPTANHPNGGNGNNESNTNTNINTTSTKNKKKRKKKPNSKQSEEAKKKAAALRAAKEEAAKEQAQKAAAEKAIAEAKAQFEAEQARIILDKETRLQAFQDASTLLSTLTKQTNTRQQSRDVLLSSETLAELRSNHQKLKKTLKSDVKKCTAFCRKVKMGGWDSSAPINHRDYAIVKDVKTLNLSRYVEEVASALMEAKLKLTDLPVIVALCKAMHERYEDFLPALMPKLVSVLKSRDSSSSSSTSQQQQMNPQSGPNGETDDSNAGGGGTSAAMDRAKEATRQRRMCLKLLVEFVLNGVVGETRLLLRIIADATGAPSSTSTHYVVSDANIIISFAKAASHEILGSTSRSVQNARALLNKETETILKMEEELNTKSNDTEHPPNDTKLEPSNHPEPGPPNTNTNVNVEEQTKPPPLETPTTSTSTSTSTPADPMADPPNTPPPLIQYTPDPKIHQLDLDIIALAKKSTEIPIEATLELRAISQSHSNTLRAHCQGAYEFFCASLTTTHTKLLKLEKRCEQDRLLVGTLSEAREKGLSDAKKMLETLRNRVEVLAELLDEDVPSLDKDENNDEDADAGNGSGDDGVGLMLWTKGQDENGEGGGNLGPFDDEDARSFYCDLPDLLTTIPPALLGLTQADVERISAENVKKYGGIIDEDETVEDGGEPSAETIENSDESIDPNKLSEETGVSGDDAIDDSNDTNDESSDKDKDTPHYKLTILLEQELPECNRRESTDVLAEKFCNNHGASKSSRKRLSKALFLIPRTRLDLLPYYSRVAATLQRVYPTDIGPPLIQELEAQFHGLARWKKNQNLEGRIKNARFIGELTKFRAAPPIVSLRCLRRCLDDFNGYNIDVACCLLECCGRYLYRQKHTNKRITDVMDTMMRIKKAKHLDDKAVALIDSAFFMVRPPTNPVRKQAKVLPPLEAYLKNLLMVRLEPQSDIISFVSKQLQRLPWSNPSMDCGTMVCKYMLKACRKGRFMAVKAVAEVAAALRRARPEISSRVIDAVLEELQSFMENPNFRDQQRVLVMSRLLGELHNSAVVPTSLIFDQLHHFINFGHNIPEALREASEKQQGDIYANKSINENDESMARLLMSQHRDISQAIPEDEELEEDEEENKADIDPPEPKSTIVAVSLHSQYDPRVLSSIDAPNAVSRIKLVCTLLESMGSNIVASNNLPKLNHFLASFQRYLFTKSVLPTEVEFAILDLFDSMDSFLKRVHKNDGKANQSNKTDTSGFVRYTNWLDAHNATISAEEAEAAAEARAKARLLAVGGADDAAIASIDEEDKEELENSDAMSDDDDDIDDESAGENVSVHSDESEGSAVGSLDSEEIDSEEESDDESESGSESGESDDETEGTDDDMYIDDDEEEIDEATAQEMYMRQLEEEAFERELRKITMEAIEKGKVAARTGKIADNMVHASQFVVKKSDGAVNSSGDDPNAPKTVLGGGEGVNFKLLKRGHKGRVEAKHFLVPSETNLAKQATKQDDEAAREREALKARVLQYEAESAEQQYSGNVYMDQTKLQVIRNRPLSMADIDRNFGTGGGDYSYSSNNSRWPSSSSDRHRSSHHGGRGGGRGRGGRSLRFY